MFRVLQTPANYSRFETLTYKELAEKHINAWLQKRRYNIRDPISTALIDITRRS
jgi:hypothetical protein